MSEWGRLKQKGDILSAYIDYCEVVCCEIQLEPAEGLLLNSPLPACPEERNLMVAEETLSGLLADFSHRT
ncbi:hypothetical protein N9112_00300 [bacterium]|nr:hypothetical protein [bacterium]